MRNKPYPYYDIAEVATLRDLIAYGETHGAENTIFYTGRQNDEPMSFIEAAEEIREVGTYLQELGFQGSHIALLGENATEWCLSYFAIANSGNVVVPLDKELSAEDLAELIEHCGCEAIFYSEKYREQIAWFQALDGDFPEMRYFSLAQFSEYLEQGRKLLASGSTLFDRAPVDPETLACIVYTSGTSGKSKGVMLTHGNLASDVVATCKCVTARNTQIFLPMNHTFSWASAMFAAFLYSVDAHISGNMKRIVKDLNRNKPQNISAVPLMVEMLYNGIWNNARKQGREQRLKNMVTLSHMLMGVGIDARKRLFKQIHESFGGRLETIICGGAALDDKLQRGLFDLGINVINGYGITECSPVVAVNRNHDFRFGSVGKPLPCNRVMIHEPDENGIGEIYVSGSNVMKGYYKDPEATAEAFDGEWFKTGDYGRLDKDGFLYITGRKKNLIILANGKNVSPEELEQKLGRIEYVREVAVYEENRDITAEFYLDEESCPDARARLEEDVRAFNSKMPSSKNIKKIRIRDVPFEKTTTMKIKRYLLNAKASEQ
ncbi:MAG: AMP-binding protein [Oscillospiraceae bacterium]|nr:AMP-binding protein [Oscillospiraceae bacterium]